jgi:hypothetical protein
MTTTLTVRNVSRDTVLAERAHGSGSFVDAFRGLMFRATLPPGEGLWLPGVNNIHMFFMRFPIDAVFVDSPDLDGGRRVVAVRPDLRPWRDVVWWVRGGHGVLELPRGTAQATATQPGDRLVFSPAR